MHSKVYITLFALLIAFFVQVDAACSCSSDDTSCLHQCGKYSIKYGKGNVLTRVFLVNSAQGCIASCDNDSDCYNQCIQNYWPGQSGSATASTADATTTAVASTTADTTAGVVSSAASAASSAVSSAIPTNVVSSAVSSIASAASSAASSLASGKFNKSNIFMGY